jgi:hypothetical protein
MMAQNDVPYSHYTQQVWLIAREERAMSRTLLSLAPDMFMLIDGGKMYVHLV